MQTAFSNLFSPLRLRHKELKNRIVFGAHTANMNVEGLPADRHFGYYRETARDGACPVPRPDDSTASLRAEIQYKEPVWRRVLR